MATAASTLITEVRRRLADETDEAYGDDELLDAINDAARLFAITTGCNQAIHNFTSGTASYIALSGLTNEYINVYGVEYASGMLYHAPRYEAVKWSPIAGTPTGWNVWANTLYLDQSITMSSTNDVDVSYTYAPAVLTSTSSDVDIPDRWMPAIKAYMRYYIHDLNREEGLAAGAWREYETIQLTAANINSALMGGGWS